VAWKPKPATPSCRMAQENRPISRSPPCPHQLPGERWTAQVLDWIDDDAGRSTIKNTLAMLVRVMNQAVGDGLITSNPARITGWQRQLKRLEDELDNPRALAQPDWDALQTLADALVASSFDCYQGWADIVIFTAVTAARIGEVSGCRIGDINIHDWTWTVRRQTTPSPGGLVDKGTKGKRARTVPLIQEIRPMLRERIEALGNKPDRRLFTGPRGGRVTTAVLRDATHVQRLRASVSSPALVPKWSQTPSSLDHERSSD
jgi:integrase